MPGEGSGPDADAHFCTSSFHRSIDPRADEPSWPSATENQQIIGDDSEPHPTLHAALAAVSAAPQAMTALERADSSFTSCSPAEGEAGNPRADFAGLAREHDVPDAALVRDAFIRRRGKAAIGDRELGRAAKELDMTIQGGPHRARS